jgi:hypothetical protein
MFKNRMLRKILGSEREEVTGDWRKLHDEELHDSYSFPGMVWVIRSRRMRLVGFSTCMGKKQNAYMFWLGKMRK